MVRILLRLFLPIATDWLTLENEHNDLDCDIKYHKPKWPQPKARSWCYYPGRQNK